MADGSEDSDSDDDGIMYSGMEQPPLLKQLKTILAEYPDDGQILKEIIQNAEDAEASELKILYDDRCVNNDDSLTNSKQKYRKYFKGPALCIYNDAEFSPDDWKGITKLYSSNKEFDKTKVGRFGLGFKSVFHVTDYPVIISGKKLLVIDPNQRNPGKVCLTIKLGKFDKCRGLNVSEFLNCVSGIFKFNQETLNNGYYKGTLFRFPLRKEASALSDNIYNESKIKDLINSFKTEAPVTLLFLKSLERIRVYPNKTTSSIVPSEEHPVFTVKVTGAEVLQRRAFFKQVKEVGKQSVAEVGSIYEITIETRYLEGTTFRKDKRPWFVYNLIKGRDMSEQLRELSEDESLGYCPYVGVAFPLYEDPLFKGHVFCFLPLPLETKSLTGLPVHVNGFFALSQNRRHIKWATADQVSNHCHKDKAVRWNECMIFEVVSEAYNAVISEIITRSREDGNQGNNVHMVSRCIPDILEVDDKWKLLIEPIYKHLLQQPFLFTSNNGGQWINCTEAVFSTNGDSLQDKDVEETIMMTLKRYNQNVVHVPDHVWNMIKTRLQSVQKITPSYIRRLLMSSPIYKNLKPMEKIHILQFILGEDLLGLELLPLQNGEFVSFESKSSASGKLFHCNPEEILMFPKLEERFIVAALPTCLQADIKNIGRKGLYQIYEMTSADFLVLLKESVEKQFGSSLHTVKISKETLETWLCRVWNYIRTNFPHSLTQFKDITVLPVKSFKENNYTLGGMSGFLILQSYSGMSDLPDDVKVCLQHLSITVIPSLPQFVIDHPLVMNNVVKYPNRDGVVTLLTEISNSGDIARMVSRFNETCTKVAKSSFLDYLEISSSMSQNLKSMLRKMTFFTSAHTWENDTDDPVSIEQVQQIAPLLEKNFPKVPHPEQMLICNEKLRHVAKILGANELREPDLIGKMLDHMKNRTIYTTSDIQNFMHYMMENINMYAGYPTVIQRTSSIVFVPTASGNEQKPGDLFDGRDQILRNIFHPFKNKFPCGIYGTEKGLSFLEKVGLKSSEDLTSADILECAHHLHLKGEDGRLETEDNEQSNAVMTILQKRPQLLKDHVKGDNNLACALSKLKFVQAQTRPSAYPEVMNWFGKCSYLYKPSSMFEGKYYRLIGSVAPLLPENCSQLVENLIGTQCPPAALVIQQLISIIEKYEDQYKPDLLQLIKDIYIYLGQCNDVPFDELKKISCLWTGNGFCKPDLLYITTRSTDIALEPYLFKFPSEFQTCAEIKSFFKALGSKQCQDNDTLIGVQESILEKHTKHMHNTVSDHESAQDMYLIINILNQLKQNCDLSETEKKRVLFPIQTGSNKLILKPVNECRYSNADWLKDLSLEDGEEISFVHPDVPHETAISLGVPSLTDDLLSDAEGFEEWGQKEPLTRRIKTILSDYTDGFAVPKEIIQNADDAGATKVGFVYDERENMDARTKLLDENMKACQGPALWAYNNSLFTKKDLDSITKLSGATKEGDLQKIGKFGLGFCSVYNLTDVPSFVTGDQFVIFDPHAKYLGKAVSISNPGLKINLASIKNQVMVKRLKNQFKPFNGIFGCDLSMKEGVKFYDGTLFRFPLRTASQAAESEICSQPYTRNEMKNLLSMFMAAAGNLLLFTQNVSEIELYHVPATTLNTVSTELIFSVRRDITTQTTNLAVDLPLTITTEDQPKLHIVKDFSESVEKYRRGQLQTISKVNVCSQIAISMDILDAAEGILGISAKLLEANWIVAWASGTDRSLDLVYRRELKKALPLGAVAVLVESRQGRTEIVPLQDAPYGFYNKSHFYCYLPLPVQSPLPVHINGSFAVTANRRQLCCETTDDKKSFESNWNEALMEDAVCNAYLYLLESLKMMNFESRKPYNEIWPMADQMIPECLWSLQRSFYQKVVIENPVVFRRNAFWKSFKDCVFLYPDLMSSEVGEAIFSTAIHFVESSGTTVVMELPSSLLQCFELSGQIRSFEEKGKIMTPESFYCDIFFQNIRSEYWIGKDNVRNEIVRYALFLESPTINELLISTQCIPTKPNGTLKRPKDIIHPYSTICKMLFFTEEERFIEDEGIFAEKKTLEALASLGLIRNCLPDDILIDRACSVEVITKECRQCGLERSKNVMKYLISDCNQDKLPVLEELSSIKFLPVKQRPKDWIFPWNGIGENRKIVVFEECYLKSKITFEKPELLYSISSSNLVASQRPILDEGVFDHIVGYKENLLFNLGVRGIRGRGIEMQTVVENMISICQTEINQSNSLLSEICSGMYKYFDTGLLEIEDQCEDRQNCLNILKDYPIILLNDTFVRPDRVVKHLSVDCRPCLYGINDNNLQYRTTFLWLLDVKESLSVKELLNVILSEQNKFSNILLSHKYIVMFQGLLSVLSGAMKIENVSAKDLRVMSENKLMVPDENCFLRPIDDLCMDDSVQIKKTKTMTFVHEKISLDVALNLGIKSKKRGQLKDHSKKLPFGQKEELTSRLKRILTGYPCDEGIFKELLQNADDAEASEIQFIKDFRHHPTNNIFDEQWKPLQGPALLVYNDSSFTESDIQGIQKLGTGSKGDDPTKTGQYGVGFNAVYHLTDAPSFLTKGKDVQTGETLCILDPHCLYSPDATEESPGAQYVELDEIKDTYSDVFHCYYEEELLHDKGTVFRFPLRSQDMAALSLIKQESVSEETINAMMKTLKDDMFRMLIFVKNVQRMTISSIVEGHVREEYSVDVKMSTSDKLKRQEFMNLVKKASKKLCQNRDVLEIEQEEVSYNMTLKDSCGFSQTWQVTQQFGFKRTRDGFSDSLVDRYKDGHIGLLPIGGVAVLLESSVDQNKSEDFTAFCFLPLPLLTGLPVLVNGHFDLDHESRRALWNNDKEDNRVLWNKTLIKNVITPTYIRAVTLLRNNFKETLTESEVIPALEEYHRVFPDYKKVTGKYWLLLTKSFYNQIVDEEVKVFVSYRGVNRLGNSYESYVPTFYAQMQKGCSFASVFNDLQDKKTEKQIERNDSLTDILKRLGMKLLDSPMFMLENLQNAGLNNSSSVTPDYLLKFLKSFSKNDTPDRCSLEGLHAKLENTTFGNIWSLDVCLMYCKKAKSFLTDLEGVPLCLTNDGFLRVFSTETAVYCTKYCHLFSNTNMFLHSQFVHHFMRYVGQTTALKSFDIQALVQCLPETLAREKFTSTSPISWNEHKPHEKWICEIWEFLREQSQRMEINGDWSNKSYSIFGFSPGVQIRNPSNTRKSLREIIQPLCNWCLLPGVQYMGGFGSSISTKLLIPLNCDGIVLLRSSFSGVLRTSVDVLNLPDLDVESLEESTYGMIATNLVACYNKPSAVLDCIYRHRQEVAKNRYVSTRNCIALLEYIAGHIMDILRSINTYELKDKLKGLPLHVTIQDTRTDLLNHRDIVVFPQGMPLNGIENWRNRSKILLLKFNEKLEAIYDLLGYETSNPCEVYAKHIFKCFEMFSQSDQETHLRYVRDNLLQKTSEYSHQQGELIAALKGLAFVLTKSGDLRSASAFHSPHNQLFQLMDNILEFPSSPFNNKEWRHFMELAGMKKTITSDLFILFAKEIEREGLTQKATEKSKALVEHLLNRKDASMFDLERISSIKFIVPHVVPDFFQRVHSQFNTNSLISFAGSFTNEEQNLMWTSGNILPSWANPWVKDGLDRNRSCMLHVLRSPGLDVVLQHIQNVCDSLKEKLENSENQLNAEEIESLMKVLYEYLKSHSMENEQTIEELKLRLELKPLVYLPEYNKCVACTNVVKELDDSDIIKPYLYPLSDEFVPFFNVFQILGTNKKVSCDNYARVLKNMHTEMVNAGASEMHVNELQTASIVIEKLFSCLQSQEIFSAESVVDLKVDILYFPSRERKLVDSSEMIYSDMTSLEKSLRNVNDLTFFIGFKELKIRFPNGKRHIERLPEKYRPMLFSELIETKVDTSLLEYVDGEKQRRLQEFIRSPDFIQGILRLIGHQTRRRNETYLPSKRSRLEIDEEAIMTKIQSINVVQVRQLEKTYIFRGTVVEQKQMPCYFERSKGSQREEWLFYFSVDADDWMQKIENKFSLMLDKCTGGLLGENKAYVFKLLCYMDKPEEIGMLLDEDHIDEYSIVNECASSIFPAPGTIVNPKWHFLLDNSFSDFDELEYIALQLADEETEEENETGQVFMYALIKKKLPDDEECADIVKKVLQMYLVDVGSGQTKEIPAYKIYKFSRKLTSKSWEIIPSDQDLNNRPSGSEQPPRSLQDVFQEIRKILKAIWSRPETERKLIIKRLLRKWHPDKNYGNENFAKEVFQYIRRCIEILDRGGDIDDIDNENATSYRTSPSYRGNRKRQRHAYEAWFDDVENSCKRDRRYQEQNADEQTNTSDGFKTRSEATPLPQEAKRWFKQACADLTAAEKFLRSADGISAYNWICYHCHQAAEKAMKAAWYYRDANRVTRSHQLVYIAMGLGQEVENLASSLDSLLGNHTKMRYPDIHEMPKIPSDMYDKDTTIRVIGITRSLKNKIASILQM